MVSNIWAILNTWDFSPSSQPQAPWIHLTLRAPKLLRGKVMAELGRMRDGQEEIAGKRSQNEEEF